MTLILSDMTFAAVEELLGSLAEYTVLLTKDNCAVNIRLGHG